MYNFQKFWEAVREVGNASCLTTLKVFVMPGGTFVLFFFC